MTYLCVPLFVTDVAQANRDVALAAESGADMVELRIDRYHTPAGLEAVISASPVPVVLTCRAKWEGGDCDLGDAEPRRDRLRGCALRDQLDHLLLARGQATLRRGLRLGARCRAEEVEADRAAIGVDGGDRGHRDQLTAFGCPDQDPARRRGPAFAGEPRKRAAGMADHRASLVEPAEHLPAESADRFGGGNACQRFELLVPHVDAEIRPECRQGVARAKDRRHHGTIRLDRAAGFWTVIVTLQGDPGGRRVRMPGGGEPRPVGVGCALCRGGG